MKVKIIYIIILSSVFSTTFPKSPLDSTKVIPEFRNIPWESSPDKVKDLESAYYLQKFLGFGVETCSFKDEFAEIDTRIDYTFKNDKLVEGSYIIKPDDSFNNYFTTLLARLTNDYGKPEFRSGPLYTEENPWIKENDFGSFFGPSFYWSFKNGFISLISQKFEDDITIIILFAYDSSIEKYLKNNSVEIQNYNFKVINKKP